MAIIKNFIFCSDSCGSNNESDCEKISGQALLNGVIIRGFGKTAKALRNADGSIKIVTHRFYNESGKLKILKLPLLRGLFNTYNSLKSSIKSLNDSISENKLTKNELNVTIVITIIAAFIIFVAAPSILVYFLKIEGLFLYNFIESCLRLLFFIVYVGVISCFKDVSCIFKYHGAEHMAITCFESDLPLNVENVKKCSRLHPRCGTSLIFYTFVFSYFVFEFITTLDLITRISLQLFLMPLAVSLSYEFVKFSLLK